MKYLEDDFNWYDGSDEVSLCEGCHCMTHTINGRCGKCSAPKETAIDDENIGGESKRIKEFPPKLTVIMPIYNAEDTLRRALDSIPLDCGTQIILVDDGSTDNSWKIILEWYDEHYRKMHASSLIHHGLQNCGVASAMNLGFSFAEGEYIVSLSSDDYYVTDFDQFRPYLDGKNDLVYFDLEVNDGSVWRLNEQSKKELVGAVKFIRREFLGSTRVPTERKYKEDLPFSQALQAKNPKEVFTGVVLKHYNWPREGSLSWQAVQDYENDRELWAKNSGQKPNKCG